MEIRKLPKEPNAVHLSGKSLILDSWRVQKWGFLVAWSPNLVISTPLLQRWNSLSERHYPKEPFFCFSCGQKQSLSAAMSKPLVTIGEFSPNWFMRDWMWSAWPAQRPPRARISLTHRWFIVSLDGAGVATVCWTVGAETASCSFFIFSEHLANAPRIRRMPKIQEIALVMSLIAFNFSP